VADTVHHALALDDQGHVEVGDQHALAVFQGWHQMAPFRADDRRATAAAQGFLHGWIGVNAVDLFVGQPAGGVHHEAAGFERVVAQRDLHLIRKDRADQ